LIYFWPITQEWKADFSTLGKNFIDGNIEIKDGRGKIIILEPLRFTYYNAPGEYEYDFKVFTGNEAEREFEKYEKLLDEYWEARNAYQQEQMMRSIEFETLVKKVGEERKAGKDVSALVDRVTKMANTPQPPPPEMPPYYVRPVDKAYVLKLPVGRYSLRYVNKDGSVMEGSEKKLVVHKKRRANGVGYDVIPADKWTRPEKSQTPSSVLYVNGMTDLYLVPFFQDEFNDLYYSRTVQNDAKGNPELMSWVMIQQIPKARLEMTIPNEKTESIEERPFYVEQVKGSALGYRIVPFDAEGKHKGEEPNLWAYHVPIRLSTPVVKLKLQDKEGLYLPGGERQIRVVTKSGAGLVSLALAFAPLVVMIFVLMVRSRRYE
jgi:hypothetical protein